MGTLTGVLSYPELRPKGSSPVQPKVATNNRVDYQSTLEGALVRRVENSEPAIDHKPPVDTDLARRDYLLKLLSKVSEEDRMLLILKEVEGHSVEELAEQTGMNENTIKVKLFRARQKLMKAAQRFERAPGLSAS